MTLFHFCYVLCRSIHAKYLYNDVTYLKLLVSVCIYGARRGGTIFEGMIVAGWKYCMQFEFMKPTVRKSGQI